jgi:hypothetical protein
MWYAGTMDDGMVAQAKTLKALLIKLHKNSAQYMSKGCYEVMERNSERGWSIWIYNGEANAKRNGFDINYEHNTWEYEQEMEL